MPSFASNQDLYDFIDGVSEKLKKSGSVQTHLKIHDLIHKTAWTSSTELLGELRNALKQAKKDRLPPQLRAEVDDCLKEIGRCLRR